MLSATFLSRLLSAILALCSVAGIAYWASQLLAPKVAIAPSSIAVNSSEISAEASAWAAKLFGNAPAVATLNANDAPPVSDSQFKVQGFLGGSRPAAVISIDGKPAKAYAAGDELLTGITLKSVNSKQIVLDKSGGEPITLAVPTRSDLSSLTFRPAVGTSPALPAPIPTPAFGAAAAGSQLATPLTTPPSNPASNPPSVGAAPTPGAVSTPATAISPPSTGTVDLTQPTTRNRGPFQPKP